jgi:hypothetical protein
VFFDRVPVVSLRSTTGYFLQCLRHSIKPLVRVRGAGLWRGALADF